MAGILAWAADVVGGAGASDDEADDARAAASAAMTPEQRLAIMLQPQSPTEILLSQSPHQKGVNWIFHDQATGQL